MTRNSSNAGRPDSGRAGWLLALVFVCLAGGIVAAGYFYYLNYEKNYRSQVERQLSAIAELKVGEIAQWRKERLGDGATLFKNAAFSSLVRRVVEKPVDTEAQRQLQAWCEKYQTTYQYDLVRLVDVQGVTLVSVPTDRAPLSSTVSRRIPEVLRSGQLTFQDFYRNEHDQRVYLAVLVPVLGESEASPPLGALVLHIDPAIYFYPFLQRWPTASLTAETLLVRREGNEVVYLNELRFQKDTALTLRRPLNQAALPAARGALGQEGVMEGIDYRGVPVVAALRAIPDSPWSLVARMDAAEVYAPIRERLWQIVVLIGAVLFGAGASIALLWRQQRVRFYHERYEAAEALRQSEERYRLAAQAAHIGTFEWNIQTGVNTWSPELEAMYGLRPGGFARTQPSWENLVHPEDRAGAAAQVQQAIGTNAPTEGEWRVTWPDGSVHWLFGRFQCFRDAANKPLRLVGVNINITARKRAEEMLRASEERFRIAAETANDVVYEWDLKQSVQWLGKIDEMLGYEPGEFPRTLDGWAASVHPEDVERTMAAVHAHLEGRAPYIAEYRVRRKDGVYRWWTARGAAARTPDGEPVRFIGSITDITERKRAEEARHQDHERLQRFVDSNIVGIVIANAAGNIIEANDYYLRLIGYTREELEHGKFDWRAITPPEWLPADEQGIRELRERGRCTPYEKEYVRRDGTRVPVFLANAMLPGPGEQIAAFVLDITERKRAETALRDSEQRLRRFYESNLIGMIYWNMQGQITEANDKFLEMVGYSREELRSGRIDWVNMTPPEYRHLDEQSVAELKATGVNRKPFEKECIRKDGTRIPIILAAAMLDEARTNGAAFVLDITERKQAEEEIKRLNADLGQRVRDRTAELEVANKELEAFAYSASHDLRAPLRGIDGFSRILLEEYSDKLDDEGKDSLARVRAASQRMAQLIDDLLKLSQAARTEMRRVGVDLTALASEIAAELRRADPARPVRWVIARALAATGDPHLLRVALDNLLNNAWKFTGLQKDACIEFGITRTEGGPAFFIRDNGVGFDMAYADRLFGPFQRLHATADFPGTGIGLATVQRIIHRHGGRVWAEGKTNHGATFYFTLPETPQQP